MRAASLCCHDVLILRRRRSQRCSRLVPSTARGPASRSGRRCHVRPSACCRRQRANLLVVARQAARPAPRSLVHLRPRVVRAIEQPVGERILARRLLVVQRPRQQARDRVDQHQRRQLAARHDEIADRDFLVDLARDQPLVDAFVAPRDQHVARASRLRRQLDHPRVRQRLAGRRQVNHARVAAHALRALRRFARRDAPAPAAPPASPSPARRRTADRRRSGAVRREIARIPHPEPPQPALAAHVRSRRTARRLLTISGNSVTTSIRTALSIPLSVIRLASRRRSCRPATSTAVDVRRTNGISRSAPVAVRDAQQRMRAVLLHRGTSPSDSPCRFTHRETDEVRPIDLVRACGGQRRSAARRPRRPRAPPPLRDGRPRQLRRSALRRVRLPDSRRATSATPRHRAVAATMSDATAASRRRGRTAGP